MDFFSFFLSFALVFHSRIAEAYFESDVNTPGESS